MTDAGVKRIAVWVAWLVWTVMGRCPAIRSHGAARADGLGVSPNCERAMRAGVAGFILTVLMGAAGARAAVVEAQPNGFAIQQTVQIAAAPDQVYALLIRPAEWWSPGHTFSGDAKNLTLDAKGSGCFCEALPNGGSVQHAEIVYANPGEALVLRGPLGPFQGQGVDSAISFTLTAKDGGTELVLDNIVGGYMKGGFGEWGARADAMLAEQVRRLKQAAETGRPE